MRMRWSSNKEETAIWQKMNFWGGLKVIWGGGGEKMWFFLAFFGGFFGVYKGEFWVTKGIFGVIETKCEKRIFLGLKVAL